MWRHIFLILVTGTFLSACHHKSVKPIQLLPGAEAVKVMKSDPTDNFTEVGPVSGFSGLGCGRNGTLGTYEGAVTHLKNEAYRKGADYVQIMTITEPHLEYKCFDNTYKISGTAYQKTQQSPSPLPIIQRSEEGGIVKRLRELQSLRDDEVITQKEFEVLKARAIKK